MSVVEIVKSTANATSTLIFRISTEALVTLDLIVIRAKKCFRAFQNVKNFESFIFTLRLPKKIVASRICKQFAVILPPLISFTSFKKWRNSHCCFLFYLSKHLNLDNEQFFFWDENSNLPFCILFAYLFAKILSRSVVYFVMLYLHLKYFIGIHSFVLIAWPSETSTQNHYL